MTCREQEGERERASKDEGSTVENYRARELPSFWLERVKTQMVLSHAWKDPEWTKVSRGGMK